MYGMLQCTNCKSEQETGKFCGNCGSPLKGDSELGAAEVQEVRKDNEEQEKQQAINESKQNEKEQPLVEHIEEGNYQKEERKQTVHPAMEESPIPEVAATTASNTQHSQGGKFKKYINFDVMITPTIIKILFWIGVAASVVFGLFTSLSGLGMMAYDGIMGFFTFILGLIIIAVGSILSRIYCELMIVFFKIQETLFSIEQKMDK